LWQRPNNYRGTAFQKGHPGGPGRPPGKRNYLTEIALQALGDDFALHGATVIEEVRKTKPHVYLQVVASLLPRQVQMEKLSPLADLTDEEIALIEDTLAASRAKLVSEIEQHNDTASFPPASQILPALSNA
jgi:hypothetical protein